MNVLQIIDEADHRVPASAPPGTQWRATSEVATPCGRHTVAIAARIDIDGHRREQFWCDDVPVERHVLLRLTCEEAECPQVIAVRAQWLACHGPTPADAKVEALCPRPLMTEVPVVVGRQHFVARPGRFPCFTPCPHGAHPPLRIDKSGFDLFEDGTCLGGGVAKVGRVLRPRIPTVRAAEAFVLARRLETLAALGKAAESSGLKRGSIEGAD
jgi:hypothetical protein